MVVFANEWLSIVLLELDSNGLEEERAQFNCKTHHHDTRLVTKALLGYSGGGYPKANNS